MFYVLLAIPIVVLAAGLVIAGYMTYTFFHARPPETIPDESDSLFCRPDNPLKGVYNPWRLRVIRRCITMTGTVMTVEFMADGDYHINVLPDPPYVKLLNAGNLARQKGALVLEIIPMDRAVIERPLAGDHVRVTGPYVLDRLHGWMEIHPVWELKRI